MANELRYYGNSSADSGLTIVARVFDQLGVQVGSDVSTTEVGATFQYIGDMPAASAGTYIVRFFESGQDEFYHGTIYWDGTQEVDERTVQELVSQVKTITDALPDSGALTSLATQSSVDTIDSNVGAILVDTGTDIPNSIAALNDVSIADITSGATTALNSYDVPTKAELDASQAAIQSDISALNDFDPANDTVANVTLVDTTTSNTDMRGTDGANTVVPPSTAQIEAALLNEGDGQQLIDAIVQAIGNVNIDQVVLIAAIRADLERAGGLLDLVPANVRTELTTELARIDAAITTRQPSGQVDANVVQVASSNVSSVNDFKADVSSVPADVRTELTTELSRIDAAITTRQPSGQVNANVVQVASGNVSSVDDFKADVSGITPPTVQEIVDGVLDEDMSTHNTSGSLAEKTKKLLEKNFFIGLS